MKRKHLTLCMCVFECYRSCDSSSVGCYQCMCARMRLLTSLKNITNRMHVCITRVEHTAKGCQRGTTLRALRRHCLSHHMAWLVGKKQQQNNPSLRKTSWSSMFPCYYHHKYPLYCYVCLCATVRLRRCFVGVCGGSMLAICLLSVSCTPTNNIAMHVAFVTYCVL